MSSKSEPDPKQTQPPVFEDKDGHSVIEVPKFTDEQKERYLRMVASQLRMNAETWEALQKHGVTEGTELILDFSFIAPTERDAVALRDFLFAETDYELKIDSKPWGVSGHTLPNKVSLAKLDDWVEYLCAAAVMKNCEFDGWGASVK